MLKKLAVIFLVLIAGAFVLVLKTPPAEDVVETIPAASTDWGLSFSDEGQPPVGNATADYLKEFDAYYLAPDKRIYLTFDAGYENGYTEKILDVLKAEEVPGPFFLVGNYIKENPDLVKRMEAEGVFSPVKSLQVNYLKPCTFGDEVDVTVGVKDFNGVVITISYDMRVNGEPVFSGTSEHVFLDRTGKFVRMKKVMPEFCAAIEQQINT